MAPAAAGEAPKQKEARWYPADDVKKPVKSRKHIQKAPKLRSAITPGTILILLSGRFRGKRVVFLKQLKSGTLLVTGPYKVNGVPLRRVNQAYVIATSAKVDISGVSMPEIEDEYFARSTEAKQTDEDEFFAQGKKAAIVSDTRKKDQATVDGAIIKALAKDAMLKPYLNAKFSLKKGDHPHEMLF